MRGPQSVTRIEREGAVWVRRGTPRQCCVPVVQEMGGEKTGWQRWPRSFIQCIPACWATTESLFCSCSFPKMKQQFCKLLFECEVVAIPILFTGVFVPLSVTEVCYQSPDLIYFCSLLSAQLPVLIMKIIVACITVFLFDNIFHVHKGLLKLSSLTSHTRQALYSH